jgi:rubrerythrin
MTKKGFFKKYEYVYDEYYDCYICPNDQILKYSTTNREGYREYKSCKKICTDCQYLNQCTESKNHVKVINRHIWEDYMEQCEDIRHTKGMSELYKLRKETIERLFGTAKENHGFRYTQMYGKARMEMKVGLTYACLNLKKLAKNEVHHAKVFFKAITDNAGNLDNVEITAGYPFKGTTLEEGLRFAIEAEKDEVLIYSEYAKIADEEGFTDIATKFRLISDVEKHHADIFTFLHEGFTKNLLYESDKPLIWQCSECGFTHTSNKAWNVCPLCSATQGFVELKLK